MMRILRRSPNLTLNSFDDEDLAARSYFVLAYFRRCAIYAKIIMTENNFNDDYFEADS